MWLGRLRDEAIFSLRQLTSVKRVSVIREYSALLFGLDFGISLFWWAIYIGLHTSVIVNSFELGLADEPIIRLWPNPLYARPNESMLN